MTKQSIILYAKLPADTSGSLYWNVYVPGVEDFKVAVRAEIVPVGVEEALDMATPNEDEVVLNAIPFNEESE